MAKSVHRRKSTGRSSKVRKSSPKTKKVVRRKTKSASSKRKKRKSSKKRKTRGKKVMRGGEYSVAERMSKCFSDRKDCLTLTEKFDYYIIVTTRYNFMNQYKTVGSPSFNTEVVSLAKIFYNFFKTSFTTEQWANYILTTLDKRLNEHINDIDRKYHYELLYYLFNNEKLINHITTEQEELYKKKLARIKSYSRNREAEPVTELATASPAKSLTKQVTDPTISNEIKATDNKKEILFKIKNYPEIATSTFNNTLCFNDDDIIKAIWKAGAKWIISAVKREKADTLIRSLDLKKDIDYHIKDGNIYFLK